MIPQRPQTPANNCSRGRQLLLASLYSAERLTADRAADCAFWRKLNLDLNEAMRKVRSELPGRSVALPSTDAQLATEV